MTADLIVRAVAYLAIGLALVPILRRAGLRAGGDYRVLADDPEAAGAVVLFWPVIVPVLALPLIGRAVIRIGGKP